MVVISEDDKSRIIKIYDELQNLNKKYGAPNGNDPVGIVSYVYRTSPGLRQPDIDNLKKEFYVLLHSANQEDISKRAYDLSGLIARGENPSDEIGKIFKELCLLHEQISRLSYPVDERALYVSPGVETTVYFQAGGLIVDSAVRVANHFLVGQGYEDSHFVPRLFGIYYYIGKGSFVKNRNCLLSADLDAKLGAKYRIATAEEHNALLEAEREAIAKRSLKAAQTRALNKQKRRQADGVKKDI